VLAPTLDRIAEVRRLGARVGFAPSLEGSEIGERRMGPDRVGSIVGERDLVRADEMPAALLLDASPPLESPEKRIAPAGPDPEGGEREGRARDAALEQLIEGRAEARSDQRPAPRTEAKLESVPPPGHELGIVTALVYMRAQTSA